jgi:hypothetical protein
MSKEELFEKEIANVWDWDKTEEYLRRKYNEVEAELATNNGDAFNERVFFGRALDVISDWKNDIKTADELSAKIEEKIAEAQRNFNEGESAKKSFYEKEKNFWTRLRYVLFEEARWPKPEKN